MESTSGRVPSDERIQAVRKETLQKRFVLGAAFARTPGSTSVASESAGHLRVLKEVPEARRGSDTALSQFLRGDLHIDLPDFCDTSMFKTIVNQARRTPAKGEERISTVRCLQVEPYRAEELAAPSHR